VLDNVQQKALQLELTPPSRDAFADFTRRHLDETIYVSIDGEAVMSPRLMEPITGGVLVISGMFAAGEVEAIGKRISAADARVEVSTQD
jgi:preprotein translocase subunit SecD